MWQWFSGLEVGGLVGIYWRFLANTWESVPFVHLNSSQFVSIHFRHTQSLKWIIILDRIDCTCGLGSTAFLIIWLWLKRKVWMLIQILWLQKHEVRVNLLSGIPRQFSAWFSPGTWVHPDLRLPVARFVLLCFALLSPILQLEPPVYISNRYYLSQS